MNNKASAAAFTRSRLSCVAGHTPAAVLWVQRDDYNKGGRRFKPPSPEGEASRFRCKSYKRERGGGAGGGEMLVSFVGPLLRL